MTLLQGGEGGAGTDTSVDAARAANGTALLGRDLDACACRRAESEDSGDA